MPCTCRECLELAARGADVELLRCVALDPISDGPSTPGQPEKIDPGRTSSEVCPIQRLQIVPFGLDELSAAELEDPDQRAYIWELDHARHAFDDHQHRC